MSQPDDFNDSLDDMFGGTATKTTPPRPDVVAPVFLLPQAKPRVQFPCGQCRGTGQFRGYSGRVVGQCHACQGRGYFLSSEADRAKKRNGARQRKAARLNEQRETFEAANPGMVEFIGKAAEWSDFARSMRDALAQYGYLTDKQASSVARMMQTCKERQEARATERKANEQVVDLSPIRAMFETAVASGHKKPIYRAAGLIISRAPDAGRNPGALYVKDAETDDYLGKILGTHYTGKAALGLTAIAADPRGEAVKFGQRTGRCSCCGATLTNGESIEAGIGPICASKWGL